MTVFAYAQTTHRERRVFALVASVEPARDARTWERKGLACSAIGDAFRGWVDRGTFKSDASARGARKAPMAAVMHNIGPYEDDGCVPSLRPFRSPSHSPLTNNRAIRASLSWKPSHPCAGRTWVAGASPRPSRPRLPVAASGSCGVRSRDPAGFTIHRRGFGARMPRPASPLKSPKKVTAKNETAIPAHD